MPSIFADEIRRSRSGTAAPCTLAVRFALRPITAI
jgi:hypothetical protein